MLTEHVTLETLITDSVAKKHLPQGGLRHAVITAENAFELANERQLCVDIATKAGLLHDIGHTTWEHQGEWDYESYNYYDIHTIKGAERAHELLIFKGEDLSKARTVALAILFHSDSSPISENVELTPLQQLVFDADDMDELKDKERHNLEIDFAEALERVRRLDMLVYQSLQNCSALQCKDCNGRVGETDAEKRD
ncbi:HD domain-containing protein [Acetohalobium arabaticum]|uniref:Metal dependent phosphohydrolase n=1 Tax=Acetohalobium arabaticum (strain ATCC 49924 / DSM 5501 / Z-7288) TaxID=574087 RepID=D9QRG8_ACEAZ|nr:HD domain-containing protein [Acetohalobium arabaticum]ADL13109.1 metal dependent phosphohydrolase [Acetohalobium arabaticum DSM 5501]